MHFNILLVGRDDEGAPCYYTFLNMYLKYVLYEKKKKNMRFLIQKITPVQKKEEDKGATTMTVCA